MVRMLAVGLALALSVPAHALDPVFHDAKGVAIRGADPVAYFTDGAYEAGSPDHTAQWMGATWRFTSEEHRARFVADPERYAPQYGGYCAYAVANGQTASTDPEAFTVVGDKLYLNYSKDIEAKWRAHRDAFIAKADEKWPAIRDAE